MDFLEPSSVLREPLGDGVELLTFNRPQRRNGWTPGMQLRYFDLLDEVAADPAVRTVVVTAAGDMFCPGADTKVLGQLSSGGAEWRAEYERLLAGRPVTHPLSFPKFLIAAVNGACAGIGLAQALYADVRFAADTATFTTSFVRRGLTAEYGTSWLLPRMLGWSAANDLLLSGRVVDAAEARSMRLVDRVLPADEVLEAAVAYAQEAAQLCAPGSIATIKGQLRHDAACDLPTSTAHADRLRIASMSGADFAEGLATFAERRPPEFAPFPPPADCL